VLKGISVGRGWRWPAMKECT